MKYQGNPGRQNTDILPHLHILVYNVFRFLHKHVQVWVKKTKTRQWQMMRKVGSGRKDALDTKE